VGDGVAGYSNVVQINCPSNDIEPTSRRSFTETDFETAGFGINVGGKFDDFFVNHIHAFWTFSPVVFLVIEQKVVIILFRVKSNYI
jgi:hypothetical protein